MNTIQEILAAKSEAGSDAYLWLHTGGDCILWSCESDSVGDDGRDAIARWYVTGEMADALMATGEVDDVA